MERSKYLDVYNGSARFAAIEAAKKDEFLAELSHLNRWYYRNGKASITFKDSRASEATDPYSRAWCTSFHAGHVGWDACPVSGLPDGIEAVYRNTSAEQMLYVNAPTAVLAIERSKLLLTSSKARVK